MAAAFRMATARTIPAAWRPARSTAFRPELINELRFGFNHLNSHRFGLNTNENLSQHTFSGSSFCRWSNLGGLPSLTFGNGDQAIGSATFLPAIEQQYSYVIGDNLNWTRGRHAMNSAANCALRSSRFSSLPPPAALGLRQRFHRQSRRLLAPVETLLPPFLLGIPDSGGSPALTMWLSPPDLCHYALDDFKVTRD